jgi:hypothetical protein
MIHLALLEDTGPKIIDRGKIIVVFLSNVIQGVLTGEIHPLFKQRNCVIYV